VAVDGPQRIALEVEEQVALVRIWQQVQRLRVGDLVWRLAVDAGFDLQPRLRGQRRDGPGRKLGHRPVMLGERRQGGDAGLDQPGALADSHARNEQQVIGGTDLDLAPGTAEARPYLVVLPRHRGAAGQVVVEQALQRGATGQIHRQQFVDAIGRSGAVAEHQFDFLSDGYARRGERVGVGRQL
jgi:hypothetical protein